MMKSGGNWSFVCSSHESHTGFETPQVRICQSVETAVHFIQLSILRITPIVCGGPCTGQNKVIFVFLFGPECLPSSVGGNMFTYFVRMCIVAILQYTIYSVSIVNTHTKLCYFLLWNTRCTRQSSWVRSQYNEKKWWILHSVQKV